MKYKPDNTIIRAKNGDVLAFDDTGLILRLSDQVIADIQGRLSTEPPQPGCPDIDAWNIRSSGDWLRFDACLPPFDHTRAYRRRVDGGSVIAEAQGPLLAVLTVGGTAASLGFNGPPRFEHHVIAPADDLGATGACGSHPVPRTDRLQTLDEATPATFLADSLLTQTQATKRPMPLIAARSETDGSTTAAALADGPGMANFATTLGNLSSAARSLGTRLRVRAVTVDFGPEDVTSSVPEFVQGIRNTVDRILEICAASDLPRPVVLLRCDGGPDGPARQWELAAHTAGQPTVVTGARYAEDRDTHGRLTRSGAMAQAMLDGAALTRLGAGEGWRCPLPILAERTDAKTIAVTLLADAPLCFAPGALNTRPAHSGFALTGPDVPDIHEVLLDPDSDAQVLVRTTGAIPEGAVLEYATGEVGGVLCDDWAMPVPGSDTPLRRWALPALIRVH